MLDVFTKIAVDRALQNDFEFLMGFFLNKYDYDNGSYETDLLVRNMLAGQRVECLPEELKEYSRLAISLRLSRALEKNMHKKEFEKYNLGKYVPLIRDAYSYGNAVLGNGNKHKVLKVKRK